MTIESFKELEDSLFGFQTEALTYDFHRKYFAVSQLRKWVAFSQSSWVKEFFHKIISFTEDTYDKIIKVHFSPHMTKGTLMFLLISIGQRAFFVSVTI